MLVQRPGARVADHDRALGDPGRVQAGLPTRVRDVDDHAHPVHLSHDGAPKVAQARVGRFGAAVTDCVAPVVGQVHHPTAELEKDADVAQLLFHRDPVLGQGHAVAHHV